jgi:transcriptional regulator with XRE-family HTH domain
MLGEKIHQLRKGKGLSQEELASRLTVSRQAVSKWELNESVPDTENVVQLSKIFGVSTDYLLNDEYESDMDIPAVKVGNKNLKTEYRSKAKKVAYCLVSIGLFGVATLWILSSVIMADKTVAYDIGEEPRQAIVEANNDYPSGIDYGEQGLWYRTVNVRGDLGAFLSTYYLNGVFSLCCAMVILGFAIIVFPFLKAFLWDDEQVKHIRGLDKNADKEIETTNLEIENIKCEINKN